MMKWVYLSSAVGGAVIALFIVSGFHFPPTGMSFSAVAGAMVAGAIGGLVLWPIVAVIGTAIWYLRYALLGIASFVIIIWLYFSHQPLWEDIVLGIAIASGWLGMILFSKYQEENERNYVATEKSAATSDTYSKDAINSGVEEKSDRRYGSESYRQLEKEQREAAKDWADRLNNPRDD